MTLHDDDPKRDDDVEQPSGAPAAEPDTRSSTSEQVDEESEESFPASDPPANY